MRADARQFLGVDTSTALALIARTLAGQDPYKGLLDRGFDTLWARPPAWIADKDINLEYMMHYSHAYALRPAKDASYNLRKLADLVLEHQETSGSVSGSWPPVGAMASDGRIVETCRGILTVLNARGMNVPGAK